jgi:hypothetical protein
VGRFQRDGEDVGGSDEILFADAAVDRAMVGEPRVVMVAEKGQGFRSGEVLVAPFKEDVLREGRPPEERQPPRPRCF